MKRLWMFLLVLVVLVLTACSSETGENKVQPAKLTDKEEVLLTTLTNTSFMFDYEVTSDVSEVRVWAEKYEAGKLVDEHVVDLMTEATEKTGSIVIATINNENEQKTQQHHIGIGDKSGSGSTVVTDEMSQETDGMMMVWGDLTEPRSFDIGEELILATIAHSSDDTGISSLSNEFYKNADVDTEALVDYDFVYVYKMMVE